MNDRELTDILRKGEQPVPLGPDAAARIRAAMHTELDRIAEGSDDVVGWETGRGAGQRRRWSTLLAAAALVLVAVAGLVVLTNDSEPAPADQTQASTPTVPYLEACVAFAEFADADGPALARAIDDLTRSIPEAASAALVDLAAAADEARRVDPDTALIAERLDAAGATLLQTTGVPCVSEVPSGP